MLVIIFLQWLLVRQADSTLVLSMMQEFEPKDNNTLITYPIHLNQEWRLSFQFQPNKYISNWANLLQLTIGDKMKDYGDRTPAIFFHKSQGMMVASAVNGHKSFQPKNGSKYWNLPEIGKWTQVVVGQQKEESSKNVHFFMTINNVEMFRVLNTKPMNFSNVQVILCHSLLAPQVL